jgi:uncharacterized membrane protein
MKILNQFFFVLLSIVISLIVVYLIESILLNSNTDLYVLLRISIIIGVLNFIINQKYLERFKK